MKRGPFTDRMVKALYKYNNGTIFLDEIHGFRDEDAGKVEGPLFIEKEMRGSGSSKPEGECQGRRYHEPTLKIWCYCSARYRLMVFPITNAAS